MQLKKAVRLDNLSNGLRRKKFDKIQPLIEREYAIQNCPNLNPNILSFMNCNNPQKMGQRPLTFNRQVISGLLSYEKLDKLNYGTSVLKRVQQYRSMISNMGAYSDSPGYEFVRNSIKKYLNDKDGTQCQQSNIYLTDGNLFCVPFLIKLIINQVNDGIMINRYSGTNINSYTKVNQIRVALFDQFYEDNYTISIKNMQEQLDYAKKFNINIKSLIIQNPCEITSKVLSKIEVQQIMEFCDRNGLLLIVDEGCQMNIYDESVQFVSFRKEYLHNQSIYENLQLVVTNSASKGLISESGLRGGYFEFFNFDSQVVEQLMKLRSISLCSNTIGQLALDLMVNPPQKGVEDDDVVDLYNSEIQQIFQNQKIMSNITNEFLNDQLVNVNNWNNRATYYSFPLLQFSQKAARVASSYDLTIDQFYCLQALKHSGLVLDPGSDFILEDNIGSPHIRISFIQKDKQTLEINLNKLKDFNKWFHSTY